MTSYQDEHAPIKFMTGVSLRTAAIYVLSGGGNG